MMVTKIYNTQITNITAIEIQIQNIKDGALWDFVNQLTVALKPYRNQLAVLQYGILI